MTAAQAQARIETYTQWQVEPVLTSEEIAILLADCTEVDRFGREITDSDWEPTYSIFSAIVDGWRLKAAKVVGGYQFSDNGQTFNRQQVYDHCMAVAREFSRKCNRSVLVESDLTSSLESIRAGSITDITGGFFDGNE